MHLAVFGVGVGEVVGHVLRQQVAPVTRGVDQHVGRSRRHRAVQDRLERLVAWFAVLKAQVVAEDDEFLGPVRHYIHDVRQVGQVGLVHLDQAQAFGRIGVQAGLDERRLARTTRTRQQHIVGGLALHKLLRVALNLFFLRIDFLEVCQPHRAHMAHGLQRAMPTAALAVAPGNRCGPVGCSQRLGQYRLDAGDELLSTLDQAFKFFVHCGDMR